MKRIIYFGHPINTYHTELETKLIEKIARVFPKYAIENPNQPKHQAGYIHCKKETGNGMQYYFEEVLPKCGIGIFLPFRDGAWGAGVFGEAKYFTQRDSSLWVWTIDAKAVVRLVRFGEVNHLSVQETRERILLPY